MPDRSPEYIAWKGMKQRCNCYSNKSYRHYGGRGIKVCDRWRDSFAAFLEDVGKRPGPQHSLDRIDNDGNYEPGNVRWATPEQQASNKRCRLFAFDGKSLKLSQWAKETGLPYHTLKSRLRNNWSLIDTLTFPQFKNQYHRISQGGFNG